MGLGFNDWLRSQGIAEEVHRQIREGVKHVEVADWIAEHQGGWDRLKWTDRSLINKLSALKSALDGSTAVSLVSRGLDRAITEATEFDELAEMRKLFMLQRERIDGFRETEKKIDFPVKQLTKDIDVAAQTLERMVKLKLLCGIPVEGMFSRGTVNGGKAKTAGEAEIVDDPKAPPPLLVSSVESRRRVLDMVKRFDRLDQVVGIEHVKDRLAETDAAP